MGLGIETDESQPFHNRWTGYRFQITIMTACFVHNHGEWEQARWDRAPPIKTIPLLGDICHAPTKVPSEHRICVLPNFFVQIGSVLMSLSECSQSVSLGPALQ